jgi:tRNA threonylcarbamoyladenosine biosynthesis protein TsaB
MKILGLDTSTMMATCALIDEGELLGEYSINQDMGHAENLVPMIEDMMKNISLKVEDIDLFAVTIGPGSFTGLRIGVATMKAFAHLYNKPIIGINTLEALAYNLGFENTRVPMLDARRNRVYTAIYSLENGKLVEKRKTDAVDIDELIEILKDEENIVVNGNGSLLYRDKLKEALGENIRFANLNQNSPRAVSVAELGRAKYKEGKVDDVFTLAPDYLRKSQAERQLENK